MAALAESFGRGAMTNHWIDVRNSDVVLIMGANPAENHAVSFRYVLEARRRGATIVHVDPRFTRTSAQADVYAPLRSGTDIAFLGGLIRHLLEEGAYHREYVLEHTNAALLVDPAFGFDDGLFHGFDAETGRYDRRTWRFETDADGSPRQDPTLRDPRCVLQVLRRHYARYDPDTVSRVTGTPREDLLRVYEILAGTGRAGRVATVLYAMGWTQHTHGTQNIRAAAIAQLLLGNVGLAGGGVNALRGESNVQGSTDHCLLFHILPGYLKAPRARHATLAGYLDEVTPRSADPKSANWWQHTPAYAVSLLKWLYGERATAANDFGFGWLPKLADDGDCSWLRLWEAARAGRVRGLFAWGQNPAVSGADAGGVREALERLDWLVCVNLWDTETSSFWRRPGADPARIDTEVFLLPCAASVEKAGSVTNSGRWAQWREKAVEPPGEARPDSRILNDLVRRVRRRYRDAPGPAAEPVLALDWNYGDGEVDVSRVAREVNGWAVGDVRDAEGALVVAAGRPVRNFTQLRADGTTASANWLYSGSFNEDGNQMARREGQDTHPAGIGLHAGWAWCWPLNRRILYNRASLDAEGIPYDPARFVIRWRGEEGRWEGDVPDGGWPPGARRAFIMQPDGRARLFGPRLADGPLPEHYEPWESPVSNALHGQQVSPAVSRVVGAPRGEREAFPLVATTYRVSEHWQTGAMTRNQPWLVELQPEMFVEVSEELAALRGISGGERVVVTSARGAIEAVAVVTPRLRPLRVDGRIVHQVGLPWQWGYRGLSRGGSANVLTPPVGDANTRIPETKAFLCDVRPLGQGSGA